VTECDVTRLPSYVVAIAPDGKGLLKITCEVAGMSVLQVMTAVLLVTVVTLTPEIAGAEAAVEGGTNATRQAKIDSTVKVLVRTSSDVMVISIPSAEAALLEWGR
jgi:hypothetical protein